MADEKKSIFDLANKFGVESPFSDWEKNEFSALSAAGKSPVISGRWTYDSAGKNRVTDAKLGDTVYFQLFTKNIPANTRLIIHLHDLDPFGQTTYISSKYANLSAKGNAVIKLELDVKWSKHIDIDNGSAIELFWIVEYAKVKYELSSILNVTEDEYINAIINDRYRYSCNCGWIDKTHAFGETKRNRSDIGAKNLWEQILYETGIKSSWKNGFKVTYTQDAQIGPVTSGITKSYFVQYGLPVKTKERIALTIFQEVSVEFEQKQGYGWIIGRGSSSFEPADLVSNLLGFYKVLRPALTEQVILKKCNELDKDKSLKVYKKYPGTFTLSEYKNYKFTPRFFPNDYCDKPAFPADFQEIKTIAKDDDMFRDWIDLFDIHKGVPPMTGPKY